MLPAIAKAAVGGACDKNDGLADGIIADPSALQLQSQVVDVFKRRRGSGCLTPPQAAALQKIYDGPKNPRTGEPILPWICPRVRGGVDRDGAANDRGIWPARLLLEHRLPECAIGICRRSTSTVTWLRRTRRIGRVGNSTSTDYSGGDSTRRQDHRVSRLERPDVAAGLQPSVLRAGRKGERRPRKNAGVLPAVHGSWTEPLQRRHRGVEFRRRRAADSTGSGRLARSRDGVGELGRARCRRRRSSSGRSTPTHRRGTKTVQFTRPICLHPSVPRYKGNGGSKRRVELHVRALEGSQARLKGWSKRTSTAFRRSRIPALALRRLVFSRAT